MNVETILALLRILMQDPSDISLPHPENYYGLFCEYHVDEICRDAEEEAERLQKESDLKNGMYML